MNSTETLNKVRTLLGMEAKLEEKKLENGTRFVAEKFAKGNEVFIVGESDEKIPVPAGEYLMEDNKMLYVKEDGIIDEIKEDDAKEEEVKEEEVVNPKDVEASLEEESRDDGKEAAVDDWEGMEKRIKNLEDAIADIKSKIGEKEDFAKVEEVVESKKLEEKTELGQIKHNPESEPQKELIKFGSASKTRDLVYQKMFGN